MSFEEYCLSPSLTGSRLFIRPAYHYHQYFSERSHDRMHNSGWWKCAHLVTGIVVYPMAFVGFVLGSIMNIGGYAWLHFWSERNATHMARDGYNEEVQKGRKGITFHMGTEKGLQQVYPAADLTITTAMTDEERDQVYVKFANYVRENYIAHFKQFKNISYTPVYQLS